MELPGTGYEVRGTKHLLPSTWYQVLGPGTLYHVHLRVLPTRKRAQHPSKCSDPPNTEKSEQNIDRAQTPIPTPTPQDYLNCYADWSLSQDVGKQVFGRFPSEFIFYTINEAHKQYSLFDTISNY